MDPDAIVERAEVRERPDVPPPGGTGSDSASESWIAVDPETGCRGVGDFEEEARANLVHAVEAYRGAPEGSVPFVSAGENQTVEMAWLDDSGLLDRLRDRLPF